MLQLKKLKLIIFLILTGNFTACGYLKKIDFNYPLTPLMLKEYAVYGSGKNDCVSSQVKTTEYGEFMAIDFNQEAIAFCKNELFFGYEKDDKLKIESYIKYLNHSYYSR